MAGQVVHDVAKTGFGTGTNELYDRARPSYISEALEHIRNIVDVAGSINVVEIGSGTGIFTRALLAHPKWRDSIAKLKAIEPSEGMRSQFSKSVTDGRVSISEGTFDNTGVEDGWADLIVIAQAFHWCPDHDAALKEFGRVLKPTGSVVLIWNMENRGAAPWVAQLREAYEAFEQGTPQFRLGLWRAVFDAPSYVKLFKPAEETQWSYNLSTTEDKVVDRVFSKSYIAILPDDKKEQVKENVKGIVARGEGKVWIDESEGSFEYPYKTYVVVLKRKEGLAQISADHLHGIVK